MQINNGNSGHLPDSVSQPFQQPSQKMAADPKSMEVFKGNSNSPEALQAAATQFEAMMVEEMLKSMRQATETLAEDNPFSSDQTRFYQGFYDSQLALEMASQRTLGVADQLVSQVEQIQGKTQPSESTPTGTSEKGVEE
ncbi:rod-binding protein [Sansalvadorimonas sp. 2012CJ34-2]|uniref:Rod-binding protein n=1 Tax=Parendozoicomonas callyspongiae TaxID=2942213 RepID=A0ABT0PFJ0_9GAMM|nr:rod-binding protein [Sansalvadorimonas sp. 2012CJ34-2]MCL6270098.1 rod-binding protein [Sansalvadorimonas sp. 2012CJ34-2]